MTDTGRAECGVLWTRRTDGLAGVFPALGMMLLAAFLTAGCASEDTGSSAPVELVRTGSAADRAVPVELSPEQVPAGPRSVLVLAPGTDGQTSLQYGPALLSGESGAPDSAWVGLLSDGLSSGTHSVAPGDTASPFSLREEDGRLLVREGESPVFAYNFEPQLPEGVPESYRRAGYVHPVWSPEGTVLTDDFPEDHYHHRGISWMWPRVRVGDAQYDLWHLEGVRQVFRRWLTRRTGPAAATVGAEVEWRAEGTTIVDERVWIRAYRATEGTRALDVRLTLEATDRPVTLLGQSNQDKGYGGFSFRFAPRDSTVIVSSEGREGDSDHERLLWADESGRFVGAEGWKGAAIFPHPEHPGHPVQWTLRHYGFLGVAWPGNDGATLQPGEAVTLRYRVFLHEGTAESAEVSDAYRAFIESPRFSESGS